MTTDERLTFFEGMLLCCHNLYLWRYDRNLNLLHSNYPNPTSASALFSSGHFKELLLQYAQEHSKPIIMTSELGHIWVAVPEKPDGELERICVLGPFFVDDLSEKDIEDRLRQARLSSGLRQLARDFLRGLPVVSLNRMYEYSIMLYYTLTGEKISVSDLHYQESDVKPARSVSGNATVDAHGTYEMEQEMVRMVREGDLDFKSI